MGGNQFPTGRWVLVHDSLPFGRLISSHWRMPSLIWLHMDTYNKYLADDDHSHNCSYSKVVGARGVHSMYKVMPRHLYCKQMVDVLASFCPVHLGAEKDVRFSFCAAAICMMLDDWEAMDLEKVLEYVLSCQSYDGGFGLCPGLEPHGGATYCAVATLKLVGRLTPKSKNGDKFVALLPGHESLIGWCLRRQTETGGFQGRANKEADSCYAFWVGGSLQMLGGYNLCDKASLRSFLLSCQTKYGGFSKYPPTLGQTGFPDLLHSYYSICGFSLLEEPGLKSLCCELGISRRAADEFPLLIS